MKMLIITSLLGTILLSACSTTSNTKKLSEIESSKAQSMVTNPMIPDWFLVTPSNDSGEIKVTATDISRDLQFAVDKAILAAKIQLASILGSKVESLTQETTIEVGENKKDVRRDVDRVSRVSVDQNIGFYTRENLSVIKEGDQYRAFVMLKLANDEARRISGKNNKKTHEESLKKLDKFSNTNNNSRILENNDNLVINPVSHVNRDTLIFNKIEDSAIKERVNNILDRPDAVVIQTTVM